MNESSAPMNEMELLRELAAQTPLPAPAELDAARARLLAAITSDPATYATAVAEVTTSKADPSTGGSVSPLRPPAPASVLTAARFMRGGAISTAALLIVSLPFVGDLRGNVLGHRLTPNPLTITLVAAGGLALIGLWLWMAWLTSQGRNWARILSTVLFGLATLEFVSALEVIGKNGVAQAFFAGLTWLSGLAAVWMLWRPASSAFFKSARETRSRPPSQISGP
jgi:hypothetical protein